MIVAPRIDAASSTEPVSTKRGTIPASSPERARQRKTAEEMASHPVWSLLSSHPDTVARASELEKGHAPHCAKN